MALLDDIHLLLRDHTGYTGDGQGGNGALPVGDRSTFRHFPDMRTWRELLKAIAQTMGDPSALQEILTDLDGKAPLSHSGKLIASRESAVGIGQENLPIALQQILVREGSHLVMRAQALKDDDPLFDSLPYWGVLARVPVQSVIDSLDARKADLANSGKLFSGRASAVAAGQTALPASLGLVVTRESDYLVVRSPTATADDPLFEASPQWGVVLRAPNDAVLAGKADLPYSGKMIASRSSAVALGQDNLPAALQQIIVREGDHLVMRAQALNADDPLFATPPYWGVLMRVPRAELVSAQLEAEAAARAMLKPLATAMTTGDLYGQHVANASAVGGAVILSGVGGVRNGFVIPAGQTGAMSYMTPAIDAVPHRGRQVFLRNRFRATPGFLDAVRIRPEVRAQYSSGGGYSSLAVSAYSLEQRGEWLTVSAVADMPDDATRAGLTIQLASDSPAVASEQRMELYSVEAAEVSGAADNDLLSSTKLFGLRSLDQINFPGHPATGTGQGLNGGVVVRDAGGAPIGFTVPVGQSGESTYITRFIPAAGFKAGDKLRIYAEAEASVDFLKRQPLREVSAVQVRTATGGSSNITRPSYRRAWQDGNRVSTITDYVVQGDETMIGVVFQVLAAAATSAERSLRVTSLRYDLQRDGLSVSEAVLDMALKQTRQDVLHEVTAGPSPSRLNVGTGGMSFAAAVAASSGASATEPVWWDVAPGRYDTEVNVYIPKNVTVQNAGSARPHIHYELPDGSATAPSTVQPLYVTDTCELKGLHVSARNARYAVHAEASGANPDAIVRVSDCRIEHLGNVVSGWVSQAAWGMGTSSGWIVESADNVYVSPVIPFSWHNNVDFAKPSTVKSLRDTFTATTEVTDAGWSGLAGVALRIQSLGSGVRDRHILEDCLIQGDILYTCSSWAATALSKQVAPRSEIQVSGRGNSPAVFRVNDPSRALKIQAADNAAADVSVSGTALPVLMGLVKSFRGVANLPAYAHGSLDVSGTVAIASLGSRLGNRTGSPISLTVTVGDQSRTVTFNANHSAATNDAILTMINAAFGGVAVASVYAVGERYRPSFTDEENALLNAQAYGIPMGSLLAFDGSRKRVRLMTSADSADLFAGVAWEDIYPGKVGRVKTRGYLPLSDILRADAAAMSMGTVLSVSASEPGRAVVGGTQGLLRGIRSDAVALRGTD